MSVARTPAQAEPKMRAKTAATRPAARRKARNPRIAAMTAPAMPRPRYDAFSESSTPAISLRVVRSADREEINRSRRMLQRGRPPLPSSMRSCSDSDIFLHRGTRGAAVFHHAHRRHVDRLLLQPFPNEPCDRGSSFGVAVNADRIGADRDA